MCPQLSFLPGLRHSGALVGVEEELGWKCGALRGLRSPHWALRMGGAGVVVVGWMLDGGSGNRWWCKTDAQQSVCHQREVSPQVADGNPVSASWDEETGDSEVCRLVSGGQRSCWHPETG